MPVEPVPKAHLDRIFDPSPWENPASYLPEYRMPFGERLVLFFRMNGEAFSVWFAVFGIGMLLAAVVAAYVGVGR